MKQCAAAFAVAMATISIVSQAGRQSTRNPAYHWVFFELVHACECAAGKKQQQNASCVTNLCMCCCSTVKRKWCLLGR